MANPTPSTMVSPPHLCFLCCYCPRWECFQITIMYTRSLMEYIFGKLLHVSSHDAQKLNQICCFQELFLKKSSDSSPHTYSIYTIKQPSCAMSVSPVLTSHLLLMFYWSAWRRHLICCLCSIGQPGVGISSVAHVLLVSLA